MGLREGWRDAAPFEHLLPGQQLETVHARINEVDDAVEERLDYAFGRRWGYLTACPTNVGTGIRVSVMLHLPGLKLTGEIERVRRAAKDMHLAVRGFYGEGTDSIGDLFQVSNQTTLGRSEEQILIDFQDTILPQVIDFERRARQALAKDLKKRGFRFCGPTIVYAFMQAVGMVNDHLRSCFRHEQVRALVRR